jgi:hypothetical protein
VSIKERISLLKTSTVEVRGETVGVVELTAGQREQLLPLFQDSPVKAMTYICAMCAREDGAQIWTPEEAANLPPDVVDAIAGEAMRISGMGDANPND